jgi:hypothetical protein
VVDLNKRFESGQIGPAQYSAMLSTMKIDPAQAKILANLNEQINNGIVSGKDFVQIQEELADAGKNASKKLPDDAMRKFAEAITELKKTLTPLIKMLNEVGVFIGNIVSTDVGKCAMITVGGLIAIKKVLMPVGGLLGSFGKMLKTASDGMSQMSNTKMPKAGGGGLASFAESFKNAMKHFSEIRWSGVLKAAASIAAFGVALSIGVAALGLAVRTFPPEKALELGISIAGIVATAKIIQTFNPSMALKGALGLAAVGAALSAGIALLGLSIRLMPPDKVVTLGIVVGGLLAATALSAAIGPIIGPALLGALGLLAVGAALSGAIALLGLSIRLMPPNKLKTLGIVVGGLLAVTALSAAIGVIAAPALIGALALIGVATALATAIFILSKSTGGIVKIANGLEILSESVKKFGGIDGSNFALLAAGLVGFVTALVGAEVADYFMDFEDPARQMATGLSILAPPLRDISSIGRESASSFAILAAALNDFASATGSFWERDYAGNAKNLAIGMNMLVSPISKISEIGKSGAAAFRHIGIGMKSMSETLKGSMWDWARGDVLEKAKQLSYAMNEISIGVGNLALRVKGVDIAGVGRGIKDVSNALNDVDSSTLNKGKILGQSLNDMSVGLGKFANAYVKAVSEEIKSELSVKVETDIDTEQEEVTSRLDTIISVLENINTSDELKNISRTINRLLDEQIFGGSSSNIGSSSANNNYV